MISNALYHIMIKLAEQRLPALLRDFGELGQLQESNRKKTFLERSLNYCEERLYENLIAERPHFKTARDTKRGADLPCWHVLPVSGVENFNHNFPHFALSISLEEGKKIIASLCYDPIKNEVFYAQYGEGISMNRKRIRASNYGHFSGSLIACHNHAENHSDWDFVRNSLSEQKANLRETGAPILDLAYLAAGRLDAVIIHKPSAYEKAISLLFSHESGSTPLKPLAKKPSIFLAANPDLRPTAEKLLA